MWEVEPTSTAGDEKSGEDERLASDSGALSFNAVKARRIGRDRRRRIAVTTLALVATAMLVIGCILLMESGGVEMLVPERN